MRNAGLDELQARIKIGKGNFNNLVQQSAVMQIIPLYWQKAKKN